MNSSTARSTPAVTSYPAQLLLGAAAALLDRRVATLRSGIPALDPVLELEAAARAIRQLAAELERMHGARPKAGGLAGERQAQPIAAIQVGPPVLTRRSAAIGR